MIKNFKCKKLKKAANTDNYSKFSEVNRTKVMLVLQTLHHATTLQECNLPGHRLHPYEVSKKQEHKTYSLDVGGKERITFMFIDGNAVDVDFIDPH